MRTGGNRLGSLTNHTPSLRRICTTPSSADIDAHCLFKSVHVETSSQEDSDMVKSFMSVMHCLLGMLQDVLFKMEMKAISWRDGKGSCAFRAFCKSSRTPLLPVQCVCR